MAYVTLATFKAYYRDELDEQILQGALDSAELAVNQACERSFDVASVTATERTYVPDGWVLRVHDFTAVTSVVENGAAVVATDYQAEPTPNVSLAGEVRPYEQIRRLGGACWYGYRGKATIAVTAKWGWAATPAAVVQATLILAKDLAASRNSEFGIAAITDFGPTRIRENGQVAKLLAPYRRGETFGIA